MKIVSNTIVKKDKYEKHIVGTPLTLVYSITSKRLFAYNELTKEFVGNAPVPLTLEEFENEAKQYLIQSIPQHCLS